jgi:hypothetical protein
MAALSSEIMIWLAGARASTISTNVLYFDYFAFLFADVGLLLYGPRLCIIFCCNVADLRYRPLDDPTNIVEPGKANYGETRLETLYAHGTLHSRARECEWKRLVLYTYVR